LSVSIDGKTVGQDRRAGPATPTIIAAEPGKKGGDRARGGPGYIPATWKTTVQLEGPVNLQRYFFYPDYAQADPHRHLPPRRRQYAWAWDLKGRRLPRPEQALADGSLFKFPAFREVPAEALRAEINSAQAQHRPHHDQGLAGQPACARQWDMILLGSVAKDDNGYLVEVKFHTANGQKSFSSEDRARRPQRRAGINGAVRDICETTSSSASPARGHGGRQGGRALSASTIGQELAYRSAAPSSRSPRRPSPRAARWRVYREDRQDGGSSAARTRARLCRGSQRSSRGAKVQIGDRVVRYIAREGEEGGETHLLSCSRRKAASARTSTALRGHQRLLERRMGRSHRDERPGVRSRLPGLGRNLCAHGCNRHGYQQLTDKVQIRQER